MELELFVGMSALNKIPDQSHSLCFTRAFENYLE